MCPLIVPAVNGSPKLAPLYNCFLTIISNLSPYAKTLSMVASVKIINLFEVRWR